MSEKIPFVQVDATDAPAISAVMDADVLDGSEQGILAFGKRNGVAQALRIDASGGLEVIATSLPLPSGAATAAKQPALGTAGTPSDDVVTVQGTPSMTALKVDGSAVTQPVSGMMNPDTTSSGTLSLAGHSVEISLSSHAGVGFMITSGSATGKLMAEFSFDGTTFQQAYMVDPYTEAKSFEHLNPSAPLSRVIVAPVGASKVRVRAVYITTGSVGCTLRASAIINPPRLETGALFETAPPNAIQVAGRDPSSGTLEPLQVDSNGALLTKLASDAYQASVGSILVAGGASTPLALLGRTSVSAMLTTSAFVGTLYPQYCLDNGTTWINTSWYDASASLGQWSTGETFSIGAASTLIRAFVLPPGVSHVRINCTARTSGTINYTVAASNTSADSPRRIYTPDTRRTIAATTSSQELAPGNNLRQSLIINNPLPSTLYVALGTAASSTAQDFIVPAGAALIVKADEIGHGAVNGALASGTGDIYVRELR